MSKSPVKYRAEACDILQHLFKEKSINDRTIRFAATFSENLNMECLKKSVDLSADAFPLIRCGFREHNGRPCWEDKGYTSDDMVEFIEVEDAEANVWQYLRKEADEKNGPQVKIGIIRSGKTDTLCVTVNHMLCDAAGFKDYLYLLSSIYTGVEKDPDYRPVSIMGRRDLFQVVKNFSWLDRIKIFTGKNDLTKPDTAKFDFEGDPSRPFTEMKTVPREKVRLLKDYAKLRGATVNDVLLTAYIRTLYQYFGRVVAVPCAVDLRKYLPNRKAGSICNLVTNLKCDIGSDIGASFDRTLEKVKEKMDRQKADITSLKSILLMEAAFRVIPYRIMGKAVDPFFSNPPIAFTNLGVLDKGKLTFGKTKMADAFMTSSIKYVPYFQIAVSTFDDVMALSSNLYGSQSDKNIISDFLTSVVSELHGAV